MDFAGIHVYLREITRVFLLGLPLGLTSTPNMVFGTKIGCREFNGVLKV
jgi:hypothetical protein